MSPNQIIVLATPVFMLLVAVEFAVGVRRGRNTYGLSDAMSSISLGMLSQIVAVFALVLRLGIYTAVYTHAVWRPDTAFWTSPLGWLLALVFYDFLYYWNHRLGHRVAVLWAAHVVHHQSEHYNLSTALRQPASYPLLGWVFYVPMALAGVPPLVFVVVGLIDLLYQFWIHTEQIGSMGRFDRWFASPSNHRVHHAVNDRYLDKNYGGILMLWDHLFGSFEAEDPREPCVYGTRQPLRSWDPLWANLEVYAALVRDSARATRWGDKLRTWLKPPGWRAADVAARHPLPAFQIGAVQRFDPPLAPRVPLWAVLQLAALLGGLTLFLWHADSAPPQHTAAWAGVLLAGLWAMGALLQGRITPGELLLINAAALSTASAASGWDALHAVLKPLAMLVAMALVVAHQRAIPHTRGIAWLLVALAASWVGDMALMLDGLFMPGMVALLLAQVAYILRLRQDTPWLPRRRVWAIVSALGALVYAGLWLNGLAPGLWVPVAVYLFALSLMASQALGRASVWRDGPSRMVAAGALCFTVSGSLLVVNPFVTPLPASDLWVLGSYHAAQCLIVMGLLRGGAARPRG